MQTLPFDVALFTSIHSATTCSGNLWDQFNLFVSNNSQYIWFVIILVIALYNRNKGWFPALICLSGFFIAWHLNDEIFKTTFNRPRPFIELETCFYGMKSTSTSFPSGHMVTSSTMATLIFLFNRKHKIIWIPSCVFALFVGYTRIYLGFHFPTDILGGVITGLTVGSIWFYVIRWSLRKYLIENNEFISDAANQRA